MPKQAFETEYIRAITNRFGTCPSFFRIACDTPEIATSLWEHAQKAYLDNPIPSLFKERLFTYLSRFCSVDYCVIRHAAFLAGIGFPAGDPECETLSVQQITELVQRPVATREEIISRLDFLQSLGGHFENWPEANSKFENCIFDCAVAIFLQHRDFRLCIIGMRSALGQLWFDRLTSLLAFVRTAHFWTETHHDIEIDVELEQFLNENPELADWFRDYVKEIDNELEGDSRRQIRRLEDDAGQATAVQSEYKRQLDESMNRIERDEALVDAILIGVPDALMLADLDRNLTYCNPGVKRVFGYEADELVGQRSSVLYAFPRDYEFHGLRRFNRKAAPDFEPFEVTWKRKNGDFFRGESVGTVIYDRNGNPLCYLELVRDVSERKRKDEKQERRTKVLDAVSSGASLPDVLTLIVEMSENARPGMIGSILLYDQTTGTLNSVGRNNLPEAYKNAIDGVKAGPKAGSCGTAAHTGQRVIVEDINSHPFWSEFKSLAQEANLRACWSEPIMGSDNQVLATLAMYFRRPQTPSERDLELLRDCAQLAAIAIDRAQAVELLRKSEQRFELAVRGSADGIWDWNDISQDKVWFSPRMFELLGYEPDQLSTEFAFLQSLVHEQDYPRIETAIQEHLKKHIPLNFELRVQVKGGNYRWYRLRAFALLNDDGLPIRFTGSLEDIQDRVMLENEATSLGRLLEGSRSEVYICDAETQKFIFVNQIARESLGYTMEELADMSPVDISVGVNWNEVQEKFDQLWADKANSFLMEHGHLRKDGSRYEVEVHLQLATYRGRESFIAFAIDISDRKKAEVERKVLEKYVLSAASEEQRRIGHDLHDGVGQELTGLVMLADTLTMILDKENHPQTGLARKIGVLTEGSLDQIRKLARGLNPVEIDSQGLTSGLIELAAHVEQLYGVDCTFEGDQEVELSDSETATQLFRIAQEAITNAVKHGNADRIRLTLANENKYVKLQIHDNGVGIDLANKSSHGTGMRSMSYRADLVGAKLEIQPHEKVGTIVSCTLLH